MITREWRGSRRSAGQGAARVSTEPSDSGVFTERIDVRMTPTNIVTLDWLAEFLGTSRSGAVRQAVNAFAGQMQQLSTDRRAGHSKGK
jgi:hypothetical protein